MDNAPTHDVRTADRQIVLVRHASTEWSKNGRHTGRTDIPLDDDGRRDAMELRQRLVGLKPDLVLTSPMSRARDTCNLAGFGDHAEIDDDLSEWDYGDYEGRTTPDIRLERPGWTVFLDGCPGGEDAEAVGRRADAVIERLLKGPAGTILIFSHSHYLRVFGARWAELDPVAGRHLVMDPGCVSTLGWERDVRALTGWNAAVWRGYAFGDSGS